MHAPVRRSRDLRLAAAIVAVVVAAGLAAVMFLVLPSNRSAGRGDGAFFESSLSPFAYTGATSVRCKSCTLAVSHTTVRVMPTGTVAFQVRNTGRVAMWSIGGPSDYAVSVDGAPPVNRRTDVCRCWRTAPVADQLSPGPHRILVENTTTPGIDPARGPTGGLEIEGWWLDPGGALVDTSVEYAADDDRLLYSKVRSEPGGSGVASVPARSVLTMWVRNTASVELEVDENGARIQARQSDKFSAYVFSLPASGNRGRRWRIDWGMARGLTKVEVTVLAGDLLLRRIVLRQAPELGRPELVSPTEAEGVPLLAVWGDSVEMGLYSLGPQATSDAYPDRLATEIGFRLANVAVPGNNATCYARDHVSDVEAVRPDVLLMAWGLTDALGDFYGCAGGIEAFRSAIHEILGTLVDSMAPTDIYVSAILPTLRIPDPERARWNEVLRSEAEAAGATYADPSSVIDVATDYRDRIHPHNGGAAKLAAFWADVIGVSRDTGG